VSVLDARSRIQFGEVVRSDAATIELAVG